MQKRKLISSMMTTPTSNQCTHSRLHPLCLAVSSVLGRELWLDYSHMLLERVFKNSCQKAVCQTCSQSVAGLGFLTLGVTHFTLLLSLALCSRTCTTGTTWALVRSKCTFSAPPRSMESEAQRVGSSTHIFMSPLTIYCCRVNGQFYIEFYILEKFW